MATANSKSGGVKGNKIFSKSIEQTMKLFQTNLQASKQISGLSTAPWTNAVNHCWRMKTTEGGWTHSDLMRWDVIMPLLKLFQSSFHFVSPINLFFHAHTLLVQIEWTCLDNSPVTVFFFLHFFPFCLFVCFCFCWCFCCFFFFCAAKWMILGTKLEVVCCQLVSTVCTHVPTGQISLRY